MGPALAFAAAGVTAPAWHRWPVYVAALAAQLAFDFGSSAGTDWLGHGVSPVRAVLSEPSLALALGRVTDVFAGLVPCAGLVIQAAGESHEPLLSRGELLAGDGDGQPSRGAFIRVPVTAAGATKGAITLRRAGPASFTAQEIELTRWLADSAALAMVAHPV